MINRLDMFFPFIPPSNNKTYINVNIKGFTRRALSKDAHKFITNFREHANRAYFERLAGFKKQDDKSVYVLIVTTYFDSLHTKTKGAEHRYSKKDSLWGIKLVQDALAELLGIDDLYHFDVITRKREMITSPNKDLRGQEHLMVNLIEMSYEELPREQKIEQYIGTFTGIEDRSSGIEDLYSD